jgi:hypothetical protein
MRPTILVPILFLVAAALSCLLIKAQRDIGGGSGQVSGVAEPTATTAG